MKDRAFSGKDVPEALLAAGAALGLPVESLRFVVLDPGSPGRVGARPTPARIAVLLDDQRVSPGGGDDREDESGEGADPRAWIRQVVREVGEAAGIEVGAEVEEGREMVVVRLEGRDRGFFLGEDGRGEVLRAVEHLLQRMFAPDVAPLPIRVECEGYRERRDAALAAEARALAETVRREGHPLAMPPLNAYERRVVHMALTGVAGIVTYSVGEGADRRVTVAPAGPGEPPERGHDEPEPGV
ncbi:MAG TPA: R3H domain-containing nucleic acid-binding protein [Vicinamibacteria bacterium]|nr:R3H domain-containing nucleic acid-binding protein [Vicinamibacteria bacterium]